MLGLGLRLGLLLPSVEFTWEGGGGGGGWQGLLEDIFVLLRIPQRKPYGTMEGNTKKAIQVRQKP